MLLEDAADKTTIATSVDEITMDNVTDDTVTTRNNDVGDMFVVNDSDAHSSSLTIRGVGMNVTTFERWLDLAFGVAFSHNGHICRQTHVLDPTASGGRNDGCHSILCFDFGNVRF